MMNFLFDGTATLSFSFVFGFLWYFNALPEKINWNAIIEVLRGGSLFLVHWANF